MSDIDHDNVDSRLEALFRADASDAVDPAFVQVVMGRICRQMRLRRVVLGTAAVAGFAVAAAPVTELSMALSAWLSTIAIDWSVLAAPALFPIVTLAAAGSIAWIGVSRPLCH